jgi:multidrug transporter EmrE-like cation transporter
MSKTAVNVILLVISIGLAIAGQLAMKAGMNRVTDKGNNPLQVSDLKHPVTLVKRIFKEGPWAIVGIMLYAISAVFWLVVLSRVPLSVAYPVVAVGYVIVVLYSRFVFNEQVKWIAWVGLAFIVIGVAITAQGLKSDQKAGEKGFEKPARQVVTQVDSTDDRLSEK